MYLKSKHLPQADRLESVLATVVAVSRGAQKDIEIANNVPGITGDSRQGRYYRNAAEMLGFVINNRNNATLTPAGHNLLIDPTITNPLFISSVLNLTVYQRLLPFLELNPAGVTKVQIAEYLYSIADPEMGETMLPRRLSTILSWPISLGFMSLENDLYFIVNNFNNDVPVFEFIDLEQPLFPSSGALNEFQFISERIKSARGEIAYFKQQARLDRAIESHTKLVNLVAERIRHSDGIPKSNLFVDLAVSFDDDFIFEMKSNTPENTRSQVRKGISQLYEYRYLQNKPATKLVLVIENSLYDKSQWMLDYLEADRNIHLVWDGNDQLYGTEHTRNSLPFLNVLPPVH